MDRYNLLQVAYVGCLTATCLLVWRRGQRVERLGAGSLVVASAATFCVVELFGTNYGAASVAILLVDLTLLAAFLFLALRFDRFWPLWVCGFHFVGIATHLTIELYPTILPQAYRVVRGLWAYPMMIAIVVGTLYPRAPTKTNGAA